ncbi:putative membrane protein HdeD [Parelusimicrobium proximum]|uniref:HdeD family acid-resistance protein n=1 Tax=Parelusimicrobium proximum TaxID=3228953 RepID=UPI003D16833D
MKLTISRIFLVISGIICILIGIFTLAYPIATMLTLALVLGIGILSSGVVYLISYFTEKDKMYSPGWVLTQGILDTLIGIILLCNLGATIEAMPYLIAFWAIFAAIIRISAAFNAKSLGLAKWWLPLITGILALLLGLLIVYTPIIGAVFILSYVSVFFIFMGLMTITEAFVLKKLDI